MNQVEKNVQVVENYFQAFKSGDLDEVKRLFHDECLIVSVKNQSRKTGQLHGVYNTKQEVSDFLGNISNLFNPKSFEIERIIGGEGSVVFSNGTFVHEVKATGKMFSSDWAQMCIIKDEKILEYHFYEDSAAYELASR